MLEINSIQKKIEEYANEVYIGHISGIKWLDKSRWCALLYGTLIDASGNVIGYFTRTATGIDYKVDYVSPRVNEYLKKDTSSKDNSVNTINVFNVDDTDWLCEERYV